MVGHRIVVALRAGESGGTRRATGTRERRDDDADGPSDEGAWAQRGWCDRRGQPILLWPADSLYDARGGLDGLYRLLLSCGGHVFREDLAERFRLGLPQCVSG